jgi:hypothetical protein
MHDSLGKSYTVAALPGIIEYFKEQGYKFDRLTNDVRPIVLIIELIFKIYGGSVWESRIIFPGSFGVDWDFQKR